MVSEIKLSPLILFFTLLIVLLVATTVKQWGFVSEGFIGYLKDANSFSSQTVTAYDNTRNITKLYDDIFYDSRNGYTVLVSGPQASLGSSVSYINVVPRNQKTKYGSMHQPKVVRKYRNNVKKAK